MKKALGLMIFFTPLLVFSQEDSGFYRQLNELVVTATRTERKLGNVAVPVSIISKKTIQHAGSMRLKDILQEQTGLFITNYFGAGVQMQGLNPDYSIILIDGEPLVGRTGGVLDLNRLAVGNIKKIEIVKGPSSSLYGSEAMAGVINVITDKSFTKQLTAGIRYGFGNPDEGWSAPAGSMIYKSADVNFSGSTTINRLGLQFFSNTNYSDASSFRLSTSLREPHPVWRFSNQGQISYNFSKKTKVNVGIRHAFDHIRQEFTVENNVTITNSSGREANSDLNINPVFTQYFSKRLKSSMRLYGTFYKGSQQLYFLEKPDSSYRDDFHQNFYRAENQTDLDLKNATLTAGAGIIADQVRSTRYDNFDSRKQNTIYYGFSQFEWNPSENFTVLAGLRYDDNKLFAAAFSPKLAIRYKAGNKFLLNASIGRGFKTPDFRQLYLNFTNNAAGGYSVYGAIDAARIISEQQSQGLIADITSDFYKLNVLKPEFSTGTNVGAIYTPGEKLSFQLNFFRNDIEELIDVRQVATKVNGAQVYSYINVKNAITQGATLELNWQLHRKLNLSSGYQFLFTADKEERKRVKAGQVYTIGSSGSEILRKEDYRGLSNRSRNMANLKLAFEEGAFFSTARFVYRSRWIVAIGGSEVNDVNSEFANGFVLINVSAGIALKNGVRLQGGIDNLFNYQDTEYVPNLAGRMIYFGAHFNLVNKKQ